MYHVHDVCIFGLARMCHVIYIYIYIYLVDSPELLEIISAHLLISGAHSSHDAALSKMTDGSITRASMVHL